jgi:hypothetical protein
LDVTQAELNDSGGLWRVERAYQNKSRKTGQLLTTLQKIARVLVRLDHITCCIINADHSIV